MSTRRIIACDSHAISAFQRCEMYYQYANELKIEPRQTYRAFDRGTIIASMLEEYYRAFKQGTLTKEKIFEIIDSILMKSELSDADKTLIQFRFMKYWKHYKSEGIKVLAVEPETAFSKIIYQDDKYLFLYEGRPDAVFATAGTNIYYPGDHKSQSVKDDLYFHNNQMMGYAWACGTEYAMYNYFGLQEGGDEAKWFRRSIYKYTKEQLEDWKSTTIQWYFRIINRKERLKSWNCKTKYGLCQFRKLCEITNDFVRVDTIKRHFKPNEHKAW